MDLILTYYTNIVQIINSTAPDGEIAKQNIDSCKN